MIGCAWSLGVTFLEKPAGLETLWRQETRRKTFSPRLWNDAYLVAFAKIRKLTIVTFDQGFRQYSEVSSAILL